MAIIQDNIKEDVKNFLKDMRDAVTVDFYPHDQSPATGPMRELLRELHELTPAIDLVEHDQPAAPVPPATPEDIEGPVSTFSVGGTFTGIRYLGFPGGQEFTTFLQDLVDLSTNEAVSLSAETQEWLRSLTEPVHLEVFVTPT
jgi:alkyl hydroperoxide reductase subunit AhpF